MKSHFRSMFGSILICLLVCSGHVYPYVHFHDSHSLTSGSSQADHDASHMESERILHNEESDHHHHTFEQYADRLPPLRAQTRGVNYSRGLAILPVWSLTIVCINDVRYSKNSLELFPRQSRLPSPTALRGPPESA